MKRNLLLLMALVVSLALTACGDSGSGSQQAQAAQPSANQTEEESQAVQQSGQAAQGDNQVLSVIADGYSAKQFGTQPVSDEALQLILQSGSYAPSARNTQPWHFTAITNGDLRSQVLRDAPEGSVAIVISGPGQAEEGINVDFDCALATQNMYLAAQSLGLGAHIYTGGVRQLNEPGDGGRLMKDELGIPEGYNAVAILLVAHEEEGVDAVSSASPRKALDEVVNYIQ